MAFSIGNTAAPDSIYKAIDASSAKVFGVKFYKNGTDGSQWQGERLYSAKNLQFTPSTYSTTGVDEFCKYSPFNQKICATKYNSTSGKQEVMTYSTESDYATAVADADSDVMVEFPKFWYLRPSKYEFLVSDSPIEGFLPSPMHYRNGVMYDKVYVSKYELNHLYHSKSGQRGTYQWQQESGGTSGNGFNSGSSTVQTSQIHRTELRKKGMYVFDYASYCAILMLGLVKYGTLNWKTFIGYGNCRSATSSSGVLSTGGADSIKTLDGGSTTDQTHAVLSFGIENLWGNTWKSIEGICQAGGYLYINTDIENLTSWPDSSMTGWTKCGQAMDTAGNYTNYIADIAYSSDFPWAMWKTSSTADATAAKIPDANKYAAGTLSAPMKIYTGGSAGHSSYVGPFIFSAGAALARAGWCSGVFAQSLAKP